MTTAVTITLDSVCSGGDHITLGVTVNGGQTRTFAFNVDDAREPIGADEIRSTALTIVKLHCKGMSKAQAKASLQSGIDLVI